MEQMGARYLGDGVYVSFDGYYFWLHNGSHTSPPVIALEPTVIESLIKYQRDTYAHYEAQRQEE